MIQVEAEAAREMARRSAREEGLLVGISSGATLAAIAQKLPELAAGATVLGFNYDTGERYLSIEGFLPPNDAGRKILIVEDEPGIADTLQYALRTDGFEPVWCATGEEALRAVRGASRRRWSSSTSACPTRAASRSSSACARRATCRCVFLTARSDEIDRVVGLELGADDYIAKPFSPRELVARVRSDPAPQRQGRRAGAGTPARTAPRRRARSSSTKAACRSATTAARSSCRATSSACCKTLASRPGHVFTRDALLERVWDDDSDSMDRTVDAHVKTLRAKMKAIAPKLEPIRTLRGTRLRAGRRPARRRRDRSQPGPMTKRTRIFIGILLAYALGVAFLMYRQLGDIDPRYRESAEESLVETAQLMASADRAGRRRRRRICTPTRSSRCSARSTRAASRADIYGVEKTRVELRMTVVDRAGTVVFDSLRRASVGRRLTRTGTTCASPLRGHYGARTTRRRRGRPAHLGDVRRRADPRGGDGEIIGAVSVGKPVQSFGQFVEAARSKTLLSRRDLGGRGAAAGR